jgi:hypothetical protein
MVLTQIACLLAALALAGGCRKKPEPAPAPPPAPAAVSLAESTDAAPPPPPPPTSAEPVAAAETPAAVPKEYQLEANIQKILMKFYADKQRPAMTWDDLVGGKYIPAVPRGPDGKPLDWDKTMQRIGRMSDPTRR